MSHPKKASSKRHRAMDAEIPSKSHIPMVTEPTFIDNDNENCLLTDAGDGHIATDSERELAYNVRATGAQGASEPDAAWFWP